MRESPEHEVKTRTNRSRQRNQMEFRMQLAHQMLGAFLSKRKRPSDVQGPTPANIPHWPVVMKKRTCKHCATKKIRAEPAYGCEKCDVNLFIKCFKPYHLANFPEMS